MELTAETTRHYLRHAFTGMERVLDRLDDDLVNTKPPVWGTNTVAGLVVHCCELAPSWFEMPGLGRDGVRDRDAEFAATATVAELRARIATTVDRCDALIDEFDVGPTATGPPVAGVHAGGRSLRRRPGDPRPGGAVPAPRSPRGHRRRADRRRLRPHPPAGHVWHAGDMARVLVVHHTPSPSLDALFRAVVDGAGTDQLEGIEVVSRPALTCSPVDVLEADGYVLGTPANLGSMSGALKHFFDTIYYPCLEATRGRPFGLYVHGNDDVQGAVTAVERIVTGLAWQAVAAPVRITGAPQRADLDACWDLGATVAATLATVAPPAAVTASPTMPAMRAMAVVDPAVPGSATWWLERQARAEPSPAPRRRPVRPSASSTPRSSWSTPRGSTPSPCAAWPTTSPPAARRSTATSPAATSCSCCWSTTCSARCATRPTTSSGRAKVEALAERAAPGADGPPQPGARARRRRRCSVPTPCAGTEPALAGLLEAGFEPTVAVPAYLALVDFVLGTVFFDTSSAGRASELDHRAPS